MRSVDVRASIYLILNVSTSDFYIGRAKSFIERKASHRSSLKHRNHANAAMTADCNLHGLDSFKFMKIADCTERTATFLEQFFIDQLNPRYNVIRDVITSSTSKPRREDSVTGMMIQCRTCNVGFRNGRPDVIRKFCSRECRADSLRIDRVDLTCKCCSRKFTVRSSETRRKFCSNECSNKSAHPDISGKSLMNLVNSCKSCGTSFLNRSCRVWDKYCSRTCYSKARRATKIQSAEPGLR